MTKGANTINVMMPAITHKMSCLHFDLRRVVVIDAATTNSGNPGKSGKATNSRTKNSAKTQSIFW